MSEEDGEENTEEGIEGAEGADGEEGSGKSGMSAKKIVLFFVLPFFLLVGVGGGLYFTGVLDSLMGKGAEMEEHAEAGADGEHADATHNDKKSKKSKKKDAHGGDEHGDAGADYGAYFLQIPNMIVNLSSEDGQTRYLRLSVQLELASEEDKNMVEAVMPRVVDQFQTYLRELRIRDLRGSQGIYRLQMELLSRVNAAAYPVEVQDVLFQEILIQ